MQSPSSDDIFLNEDFVYDFDLANSTATPLFQGGSYLAATDSFLEVAQPFKAESGETVYVNDVPDLVVANPDGTTAFFLKGDILNIKGYGSLSDDGTYLLYQHNDLGIGNSTEVVDRSKNLIAVHPYMEQPTWTRDGRIIMVAGTSPPSDLRGLFITDSSLQTTTSMNPTLSNPLMPSVNPDNNKVAFSMSGHIWTMGLDGVNLKQITSSDQALYYPAWSPDGRYIVTSNQNGALAIVPADPDTPTTVDDDTFLYYLPEGKTKRVYIGVYGRITWR